MDEKVSAHYDALIDTSTGAIMPLCGRVVRLRPRINEDSIKNDVRYVCGAYYKIQETAVPVMVLAGLSREQWKVFWFLVAHMTARQAVMNGRRAVTDKWIAEQQGMSAGGVRNLLYKLREAGLIAFGNGNGPKIYINPFVVEKAMRHPAKLIDAFRETEYYAAWAAGMKTGAAPGWY